MPSSVQDLIRQEAQKQGVPPELALGVAEQESSFNPTVTNPQAVNGEHAIGTFQLLPSTAKGLGVDPADPRQNISGGVKYLRQLLDQHQGDLNKVLSTYGGVKTDQTYVPSVLAKVQRWKQQQDNPFVAPLLKSDSPGGPPAPTTLLGKGVQAARSVLGGFDIRTPGGRQNVAGAVGAAGLTMAAPELALPAWAGRIASAAIPVAGAYAGGATEQAGEDLATGKPPSLESITGAGRHQATQEAVGQGVMRGIAQPIARRLGASTISERVSTALDDALQAAKDRIGMIKSRVSPGQAGQLAHDVAYGQGGAAKTVKDTFGQEVEASAKTGPAIPTAPLQAELDRLRAQITPMASHQPTTALPVSQPGASASSQAIAARQQQALALAPLPSDHPLPGTLDAVENALQGKSDIPFEDAHKLKRALDDAVNWDSPAKKQAQQITKGFRGTLRDLMSSHQPYNQATENYQTVARLYNSDAIKSLRNAAQTNPSVVVNKLKWNNPAGIDMVHDLLHEVPKAGSPAGAQEGEAAWNAVRAAWTHENLFAKGPAGMAAQIQKIESSGHAQEFLTAMYGDQQGQTIWKNAKQLSDAWQVADSRVKEFSQTDLANTTPLSGAVRDAALTFVAPGHTIGKVGAISRFLWGKGTRVPEMLEWASHSDQTTQFVVKHILTGPNPGMALSDFMRWYDETNGQPDKPTPSHAPTGGPPVPTGMAAAQP